MFIRDIAHSLGSADYPPLSDLRDRYAMSQHSFRVFDRLFGLQSTALHLGQSLEAGLRHSAQALLARNPHLKGVVDLVVYAHALNMSLRCEDGVLTRLARDIFESEAEVMSVTHGSCASAILVLHVLRQSRPDLRHIVVLTGEKCFFELLDYAENNGLFGEATSASWISAEAAPDAIAISGTAVGVFQGVSEPLARADKETAARYDRSFLPTLQTAVETALTNAACIPADIDVVLPTHLSPFTFNRMAERLSLPDGRVIKANLARIGHCFCGDLFINLATLPAAATAETVMSFAAGMTGSYAAIILNRPKTGELPQ